MNQRRARTKIEYPDGRPRKAPVIFWLDTDTFDEESQVPRHRIVAWSRESDGELLDPEDGEPGVKLLVNEDMLAASQWACLLPDSPEPFWFTVPSGVGDITISFLRENGATQDSKQGATIVTFLKRLWRDEWRPDADPSYSRGEWVHHLGVAWIALVDNPSGEPGISADWGLFAAGGPGIRSGSGPPDPEFGRDGEFYIDTATQPRHLYGPKTEAWEATAATLDGRPSPRS
jgi:hypothetical protein